MADETNLTETPDIMPFAEQNVLSALRDHFVYYHNKDDAKRTIVTTGDTDVFSVMIEPDTAQRPEAYVRLLWSCDELRNALVGLEDDGVIEAEFRFPSREGADLTWVALIQGDPHKGATFLHQIWHRGSKVPLEPNRNYVAQLGKLDPSKGLHICYHFKSIRERSTVTLPEIRFKLSSSITIERATCENFEVAVSGIVFDKAHPGMPVSIQLEANGQVMQKTWARAPADGFAGSYKFKLGFKHSDLLELGDLALVLTDSGERWPITLEKKAEAPAVKGEDPLPILPTHTVVGKVDAFTRERVVGWALCKELPDTPVDVLLSIDGMPFSHVRCKNYRPDTIPEHGGSGYTGFEFEVPLGTVVTAETEFSVIPLIGQNRIRRSTITMGPIGPHVFPSHLQNDRTIKVRSLIRSPKVSVIVLNQNGADLLVDLFTSAKQHEEISKVEWIIVDHQSKDHSEQVCNDAIAQGHNVKFMRRNGNYSFSDSNNYGVAAASHDILIFANNDLIFNGPFVKKVASVLRDNKIGLVGASLTDYIPDHVGWDNPPPIQHLGVYFNTNVQGPWIRAYEARATPEVAQHVGKVVSTPVTTGAFMGMRRADFEKIGGFDTEFFYGLEDVDLCLKVMFELDKAVATDNGLKIAHHRGFSRSKEGDTTVRRRNNNNLLNTRWGNQLRQSAKKDILRNRAFWTGSRPVFGFAVVDAGDETSAGEYFTALELARAMQKIHPIHVRFLTKDEWTDLSEIDVLVVMVNGFNLHQVKKASPFLVTINWTRQWFDRWAEDETIHSYDIVFASSQRAADYMHEQTGIDIDVLPIATDFDRFSGGTFDPALASDYCLTGNKVGTKREIEFHLDPDLIAGDGAIFGHNWEGTKLGKISRGPIAYSQMAEVYASSKIAIDDANIATKAFGSCNSRVFDSIAGGTLLITNGALGVQELFGDLVPTYTNKEELTKELNYWIANDDAREKRISELQALVKAKHTYDARAAVVSNKLMNQPLKTRIAIKCAAPYGERHVWGDTHFANSLAKSLRKQGFTVRVDYRESWNAGLTDSDDVVIMLRGILGYKPKPHQYAIMWLISHPTAVPTEEFDNYDHIFVASKPHASVLAQLTDIPVDVLLQCTDTTMFKFNEDLETASRPTLFVGNSRGIFRPALRWSIEMDAAVDIYGSGWEQFVTDDRLKGTYIPNQVLPSYYQTSQNVLCDHWDDMKRLGYLSNRAFDVLAVGGWLTVDDVEGVADILDGGYSIFRNKEELAALLKSNIPVDIEDRRKRAAWVAEHHSFDARAKTLADTINAGLAARTNPATVTRGGTLVK